MLAERTQALTSLLDLFVTITKLPIGLYEVQNGQIAAEGIFSKLSLDNFESHCRLIQSFPGGKVACEADQCNRARNGLKVSGEHLSLCHAGIYNQIVPLKGSGGKIRAILLYGEMQIDGEEYSKGSLRKHREAVKHLGLNSNQAKELRTLLFKVKKLSPDDVKALKQDISGIVEWFYILLDQEEELKRNAERVRHEIQIRLTAVIAHATILAREITNLSADNAQKRANLLLSSTKALETVMNNLGQYLEDYHFEVKSLVPLIEETKRFYEAEADYRKIDIHIELQSVDGQPPILEFSHHHMQHALGNLLQNAIKYSFRGRPDRRRYVRISGKPVGNGYRLTFSNYGVGIRNNEITSGAIFEDGYQGVLTQGEYRTGSGKGLHFVKKIIENHHGRIEVQSELVANTDTPEGEPHLTSFHVFLPFRQPKD